MILRFLLPIGGLGVAVHPSSETDGDGVKVFGLA
jgi:hypothetical protein